MEKKIALLIIYNHRYDKNIPVLDELFKNKFSYVYHIVPFYDGERENVLPVYESSYYFSGYIAQALNQIKDKCFTHYVFTSDDLMLNPAITENNIHTMMGLDEDACYIPRFRSLKNPKWARSLDALGYNTNGLGAEVEKILPSKEMAVKIFEEHGYNSSAGVTAKIAWRIVKEQIFSIYNWYQPASCLSRVLKCLFKKPCSFYSYNYPLMAGYNDFFIIPSTNIMAFTKYCGAFAASRLFVEVAIPTAMVLSCDKIKTAEDTKLKCGDLWLEDVKKLENEFEFNLSKLYESFPKELLYRHPVKLSKWK